jgi:hypothetical protein
MADDVIPERYILGIKNQSFIIINTTSVCMPIPPKWYDMNEDLLRDAMFYQQYDLPGGQSCNAWLRPPTTQSPNPKLTCWIDNIPAWSVELNNSKQPIKSSQVSYLRFKPYADSSLFNIPSYCKVN